MAKSEAPFKTALLGAGFSEDQATCSSSVFSAHLSDKDMAFLTEAVVEGLQELYSSEGVSTLHEVERVALIEDLILDIPYLSFVPAIESSFFTIPDINPGLVTSVQLDFDRQCGEFFDDPYEDYYIFYDAAGEIQYLKRADVTYDAEFYSSPSGYARCIKVFRNVIGMDPNAPSLDDNTKYNEVHEADLNRVVYLMVTLADKLDGETEAAGLQLANSAFTEGKEVEHQCRASFPDADLFELNTQLAFGGDTDEFKNKFEAVSAAERKHYKR